MQEQKKRRKKCGKIQIYSDEPCVTCLDKFFDCAEADCVEKPGNTQKHPVEHIGQVQGNLTHDAASSSQGWRKLVTTEEDQEHLNYPEDLVCTRKLVASGNSGNSGTEGNDPAWPHSLHKSTNYVLHMEKVFSIVRQRYGLSPADQMKDLDVNTTIWGIFMSVTLQAAVHLGKEYTENLRSTKNQPKKPLKQLLHVTERLITDQIDRQQPMWRETTLLTDRAVQFATATTCVFADSVPGLGVISTQPVKAWESKINCFWKHVISNIWIESSGSRWSSSGKYSEDSLQWEFSSRFKRWWMNQRVNQSNSREGSSSCQCTMTLIGKNEETKECAFRMLSELLNILEQRWYGRENASEGMMLNFAESGPCISCQQLLRKRRIKKQSKKSENHSLQRWWWHHWVDPSHNYFR